MMDRTIKFRGKRIDNRRMGVWRFITTNRNM